MITDKTVKNLTYKGDGHSRCFQWDSDLMGFGLRVYPSGVKAFVVSYRNSKAVKRLYTIGRANVLTAEQARRRAKKILLAVVDGKDPQAEKAAKRQGLRGHVNA